MSHSCRCWFFTPIAALLLAACGSSEEEDGSNAGGNGNSSGGNSGGSAGASGGNTSTGGGGGAGGSSSGGTAGSAGSGPAGMHCTPGETDLQPFFSGLGMACYGDRFAFGLPNPLDVTISDFVLPEPMLPGQPYAISLNNSGGAPMNVELWGTDAACGVASELLWWAAHDMKIQCAEFTPSGAHSHVLFVRRLMREASNFAVQTSEVTLCASGSCPAGADGQGLMPGGALVAPVGGYQVTGGSAFERGQVSELGGYGNMVLVRTGADMPAGTIIPLAGGFFRLNKDDPFGDAWYCIGDGSSLIEEPENVYNMSLRNITRLGDCENSAGTGTMSVSTVDFDADIIGTFAELSGLAQSASEDCLGTYCRFQFAQSPSYSWLYPTAAADLGNSIQPTGVPTDIVHAAWFVQTDEGAPIQMTCAAGGSITLTADTTTIDLSGMSDFVSCPGEATSVTELDITRY